MSKYRFSALIPAVFSAVAFALLLILVVAGTSPQTGSGYYLISLNTSKIGSNTIKFSPATSTTTDTLTGMFGGLFDGVLDGLGDISSDLTSAVDSDITNLEADIVTNLTGSLGIHDVYNIYMHNICELDYQDPTNPSAGTTAASCPTFSDVANGLSNLTSGIPSYVVVGTTNITVPLLSAAGDSTSYLQSTITSSAKASLAFQVIGLVSSGLVAILSVAAVFLPRSRRLVLAVRILSSVAPLMLLTSAIVVTCLISIITNAVNGLGSSLTISAQSGKPALAVSWITWALSSASSTYWFGLWFVTFRRSSITRRTRTEAEMGNWRGVLAEVRRDLTLKKKEKVEGVKTEVGDVDVEKNGFKIDYSGNARPERAHVARGGSDGEVSGLLP